ncbi:KEOPS complex subunit Cgi121 [Haloplanus aerogenes]|uniref:KEOPS complex component n=1 Tax=Haloplanus aerogenes TaxID=660522 RepID=A0A3M0D0V7_9EURY|nr:KEOPS complex subunit Cgi121 [Haloplanus aerogenes]AZH24003.1 KEOPS complex component [Haloplanus aerogenes]RMB13229.1 KEOPS complex subunit Cgi121 [Haloplanus aerogenes]
MRLIEGDAEIDDLDAFLDDLNAVAADHGVTVQAFDARYVVGRTHLERAVELADRAIARGENVARERGVEILLYAAGRRQIDDALAMGVSEGKTPVVVLVSDADGDGSAEQAAAEAVTELLDPGETLETTDAERVRSFFDITEAELAAVDGDLADLVAERVALLDVEK